MRERERERAKVQAQVENRAVETNIVCVHLKNEHNAKRNLLSQVRNVHNRK